MEEALVKALAAAGGLGGILAALMFVVYQREMTGHQKRQDEYIAALTRINDQLLRVVADNTAAMTSLNQSTNALQAVVSEVARELRDRDAWVRERLITIFKTEQT